MYNYDRKVASYLAILNFFQIRFDIGYLVVFATGVVFGFFFLLLVYLYTLLKTMQSKRFYRKAVEPDIDEEEIKLLIKDAQTEFKNKKLREEVGLVQHVRSLSLELSKDIATKFYPESKYPLLELTIDETLMLGHYITDRIDKIFSNSRLLKIFRGKTLANLMALYSVKTAVDESAIMQVEKKFKVKKRLGEFISAINIVNPAYWIRKVTVDKLTQQIIFKICTAIIGIVGEETYKIYSKNVFEIEKNIDTGVDDLYDEIRSDSKEIEDETNESV